MNYQGLKKISRLFLIGTYFCIKYRQEKISEKNYDTDSRDKQSKIRWLKQNFNMENASANTLSRFYRACKSMCNYFKMNYHCVIQVVKIENLAELCTTVRSIKLSTTQMRIRMQMHADIMSDRTLSLTGATTARSRVAQASHTPSGVCTALAKL